MVLNRLADFVSMLSPRGWQRSPRPAGTCTRCTVTTRADALPQRCRYSLILLATCPRHYEDVEPLDGRLRFSIAQPRDVDPLQRDYRPRCLRRLTTSHRGDAAVRTKAEPGRTRHGGSALSHATPRGIHLSARSNAAPGPRMVPEYPLCVASSDLEPRCSLFNWPTGWHSKSSRP